MSVMQNNPEPDKYLIERGGENLREWKVSYRDDDGEADNELGTYATYTDAVAAINEDRGVDPEDVREEATEPAGGVQPTGYDDDWDDHSEHDENQ